MSMGGKTKTIKKKLIFYIKKGGWWYIFIA
jgi:hypothetical protein